MATTIEGYKATTTDWNKLGPKAKQALIDEMVKNIQDPFEEAEDDGRFLRALIYGEAGCGKTTLAANLGRPEEKVLFYDFENSTEVLADHKELKGRIKIIRRFPGLNELRFTLKLIEQRNEFKTVVIDSLTSMMTKEMLSIMNNAGFTRSDAGEGYQELSTEQDYGLYLNRLNWFLDTILETRINVILLGHVKNPSPEEIAMGAKRRAIGSENQIAAVTSRLGNVFFMEDGLDSSGNRKRTILTRTDNKVQAKTRIATLPDRLSSTKFITEIQDWRKVYGN